MRDYAKVYTSFWSSANIRTLSDDGRMLALYLMSCPHSTIAGVFRLPDGYVCEDMQWSSERVNEGFAELLANGFANRCETTKWVWIIKHFEWNPPENPNQRKAARKCIEQVPDECAWKPHCMAVCGPILGIERPENAEHFENPSATLSKPETETETGTETGKIKRSAQASPAPSVGTKSKRGAIELQTWIDSLPADSDAIAADDPVFAYAESIHLPREYVELAWTWFKPAMAGKRKTDWRAHFRNAVRNNWPKYWWPTDDGGWRLSPAGEQAKRAMEAA